MSTLSFEIFIVDRNTIQTVKWRNSLGRISLSNVRKSYYSRVRVVSQSRYTGYPSPKHQRLPYTYENRFIIRYPWWWPSGVSTSLPVTQCIFETWGKSGWRVYISIPDTLCIFKTWEMSGWRVYISISDTLCIFETWGMSGWRVFISISSPSPHPQNGTTGNFSYPWIGRRMLRGSPARSEKWWTWLCSLMLLADAIDDEPKQLIQSYENHIQQYFL